MDILVFELIEKESIFMMYFDNVEVLEIESVRKER